MFSSGCGFLHARDPNRESITIVRRQFLVDGVRYWNDLAGWELLAFSDDFPEITADFTGDHEASALITDVDGGHVWTKAYASGNVSIDREHRSRWWVVAHELGHCLGFKHQRRGVMLATGVLDHARRHDRRMLKVAGYYAGSEALAALFDRNEPDDVALVSADPGTDPIE